MDEVTLLDGREGHVGEFARIGIVTVSDRASAGAYEDEGGPAILGFLREAVASPVEAHYRCVPDDADAIGAALIDLCDDVGMCGGGHHRRHGTGGPRRDAGSHRSRA